MALARTPSSSAVRRGTLPISLRYMRTGSSMPIMSAAIASSSSWVGSSACSAVSLVGGSSQGCWPGSSTETETPSSAATPSPGAASCSSSEPFSATRSSSMPRRLPRSRTAATRCVSAGSWAMRVLLGDRCGGAAGGLGKQGFIVEPTVELGTPALALGNLGPDPVRGGGVAGGFGLGQLGALEVEQVDEAAAFEVEQALLERLLQDRLRLGLGVGPGGERPAGGGRRDEVRGWQPVAHAELPGGVGQEEPKQRGLDRLQGAGDRLGVESAWAGEDGIGGGPPARRG